MDSGMVPADEIKTCKSVGWSFWDSGDFQPAKSGNKTTELKDLFLSNAINSREIHRNEAFGTRRGRTVLGDPKNPKSHLRPLPAARISQISDLQHPPPAPPAPAAPGTLGNSGEGWREERCEQRGARGSADVPRRRSLIYF